MSLKTIINTLAKAFEPMKGVHGPYHPEPELIPILKRKGYEVRQDFFTVAYVGTSAVVYNIYDSDGNHINPGSPKECKHAYNQAYQAARKEAGLAPADTAPTAPAPK